MSFLYSPFFKYPTYNTERCFKKQRVEKKDREFENQIISSLFNNKSNFYEEDEDIFGFNNYFKSLTTAFNESSNQQHEQKLFNWSPKTNIQSDDSSFKIKLELPGLKKDQIDVELTDRVLTISGEKKESKVITSDNNEEKEKEKDNSNSDDKPMLEDIDDDEKETKQQKDIVTTNKNNSLDSISKNNKRIYHVSEISYGSFKRSFSLPKDVDPTLIKVKYEDGTLFIDFQRNKPTKKSTKININ